MILWEATGVVEGSRQLDVTRPAALRLLPLVVVLAIGGWLCAKDITSEASAMARGDNARSLMNGVFIHDFVRDLPGVTPSELMGWAQRYYARYPALSIGHHPVLLPVIFAGAYAVLGVSVFAARLVLLIFFLAALAWCYALLRELYDDLVAFLGTAIVATNPFLLHYARSVLSEVPAIAFGLGALYYLVLYGRYERLRHLILLVALTLLSIYAKQLAIFLIPLIVVYLALTRGWRHLLSRRVLTVGIVAAVLLVPVVAMTLRLSPHSVKLASQMATGARPQPIGPATRLVNTVVGQSLAPAAVIAVVALLIAMVRRDWRPLFFASWVLLVFSQIYWFTGGMEPERHAMYWIPAIAALAAGIVTWAPRPELRWVLAVVVLGVSIQQGVAAAKKPAPRSTGYDEAAAFVAAAGKGDSVLFSGPYDTGLFVFGIRKHDRSGKMVVLRADKLLATSKMGRTVDRITRVEEIYETLQRFGTAFVVLEDVPVRSHALELLRTELGSPRFVERQRFSIDSNDRPLIGAPLVVYEYLDAKPADRNARLDMSLPIVGQSVGLRFGELLEER
jgi:hypothetical protein